MTDAHSIWLLPSRRNAPPLEKLIRIFDASGAAGTFAPHVTLLGDLGGAPDATGAVLERTLGPLGPVQAKVQAVARTPEFFMALFLDLALTPALDPLRSTLADQLGGGAPAPFRPHLSLCYGQPAVPDDQLARLESRFAGQTIVLDRIAVVHSAKAIPIKDWRILSEITL